MRGWGPALLASLLTAGCASGAKKSGYGAPETVVVEGWAALGSPETRALALGDARREAVAQAVRAYAPARTLADHSQAIGLEILGHPERYIKKERVVGERSEGSFTKLRLNAEVLFRKVAEDLERLGLLASPRQAGLPRLGLALPDDTARELVFRTLKERGFLAVSASSHTLLSEDRTADLALASLWGKEREVDIVVAGRAAALPTEEGRIGGLFSYRARVELTATDPREMRVLVGAFQEASALGPEEAVARAKALETASRSAAEELAGLLPRALGGRGTLDLRLYGIGGPEELRKFQEDLRAAPKVREVRLVDYRAGDAWLRVATERMTAEELAAAALRLKAFAMELRSVSQDEIELIRREKM